MVDLSKGIDSYGVVTGTDSDSKMGVKVDGAINDPRRVLTYTLEQAGNILITIQDMAGNVRQQFQEYKDKGSHQLYFDASALNTGIHFVRVINGKTSSTKRIMVLR